jgi:S1-C subfamily serine protease
VASPPGGVRVLEVVAGGAAARAGLRDGDTIVSVRGHDVTGMAELQSLLYFIAPGTRVDVGVVRDGHPVLLDTVLGRD